MKYRFAVMLILLPLLALFGCSSGNSGAPSDNAPHPLDWIRTHPVDALAVANFEDCVVCHGTDLQGSGEAVSCFSCHSYNNAPLAPGESFIIHSEDFLVNPYIDHRAYAAINGFTSCANCHGADLLGSPAAPSCFSASFDGQSCHPGGPGSAPHPVDGTYLDGAIHGPEAKTDLTFCQDCHGQGGGAGSNPRFNIGINSVSGTGCEAAGCHGVNYAHPTDWAGPNNTFHYSAGNIQNACTLCHGVDLDGIGGVGISCLDCHDSNTAFTLDCTACHGFPPDGTADVDVPFGVDHRGVANVALHDTCVVCHGMKESGTGGGFSAEANYQLFDPTTDTIGDHWNGSIEMNASTSYNQTNFGCDAAGCHVNDVGHQLSDSGLPVELKNFGFGGAVPHPVDLSFLFPQVHGPAAKGLTAAFPNGMADCQPCHAQPGANPRFNVGINSAGGNGCESCHNDFTAHPSVGPRDIVHWYDGTYKHSDVTDFTTICSLCHGAALGGAVGPACTACHSIDPVANASGCVSCHNLPPDGGAPAGNVRPNRQGQHNRGGHTSLINPDPTLTCGRCHNGAGVGTDAHFDFASPADVNFSRPDASDTISAISTDTNTTCNGDCHIVSGAVDAVVSHTNATWY